MGHFSVEIYAPPGSDLSGNQQKQPIPIGYGVMAADEVMQRIFYLTKIEPGSDY